MNGRAAFPSIADALDRAAGEGRSIGFWWRDDDAVRPTAALDRLLALSATSEVDVTLAVVPAGAERSLAERLTGERGVTVAVHGWSHANHAPAGEKQAEFGAHRPMSLMREEARRARESLGDLFPRADLGLFVPPWNRIAPALVPALEADGYRGVSGYGSRAKNPGVPGPNTHVDPVDWRGSRSLIEPARIEAAFVRAAASGEAVGILTHHLCFDEALWLCCERLLALLARHPGASALSCGDLLPDDRAGSNSGAVRDLLSRPILSPECRP